MDELRAHRTEVNTAQGIALVGETVYLTYNVSDGGGILYSATVTPE